MMRLHLACLTLWACLTLCAAAGCQPATEVARPPASPTAAESSPAEPAGDVQLTILDYDGIQQLVGSHREKMVVMDVWSTACPPCVKEFPNLVALHAKYSPRIACISLSLDYEGFGAPQDVHDEVLAFLQRHGAVFDNVLSSTASDELLKQLDLSAPPAVFIYDNDGQLVRRFDNSGGAEFTYEDVEAYVKTLLEP